MRNAPRRRPSLEALEDRRLPALFGLPWPDPSHLTLSFVPDGTAVGDARSVLSQTLNATLPTPTWKADILRAFQSWAVLGNINIGVVPDNGQAVGQPGPLQGNSAVGDIRVSARPLSSNVLSEAIPFDLLGTWSGTFVLNSNGVYGDGSKAPEDLFNAALHEAGHILGLPDNDTDPTSAMYDENAPLHTGPNAADINALQALYGVRQAGGADGNDTLTTATPIAFLTPGTPWGWFSNGLPSPPVLPTVVNGDISSLTDKDVYSVNAPTAGGSFVVDVRTSGISLLKAKVSVVDSLGQCVASAAADDLLQGDLVLTVRDSTPGATYYVRVESSQSDVFGIGAYRLAVGTASLAATAVAASSTTPIDGSHSYNQARDLQPQSSGDARWPYLISGQLSGLGDADYYRISTASATQGTLIVSVWGLQSIGFTPSLTVFDARHNSAAAQVVAHDASSLTLKIPAVAPNTRYTIEVSTSDSSDSSGGFELGATFSSTAIDPSTVASDSLTSTSTQAFRTLQVNESGLFHFDLSAMISSTGTVGDTAVRMTIYDSSNTGIFSIRTVAGTSSGTGDVLLGAGTYKVRIVARTRSGAALPAVSYALRGALRSDPIDPSPSDPTLHPSGPNQSGPPPDPYDVTKQLWDSYLAIAAMSDPYSNPWGS
jgi:hypothetical protein